jgi:hypothetical protein
MKPSTDNDRARLWAYVLVAIAALLAGFILGQLGREPPHGGSRIDWPHPVR